MLPLAPARFSTTTVAPVRSPSRAAIFRAIASPPPPAEKGTITRIGRDGYVCCALADVAHIATTATPAKSHLLDIAPLRYLLAGTTGANSNIAALVARVPFAGFFVMRICYRG